MPHEMNASDLSSELLRHVRRGDTVWTSQGCAEPLPLTQALVAHRDAIGPCTVFPGMLLFDTFRAGECAPFNLLSYGGVAKNAALVARGDMDVVVSPYSSMPRLIDAGCFPCDVVILQLSAEGPDGRFSLGIAHDYLMGVARRARVVLAEVNDQMPWTPGSDALAGVRIDAVVRTSRPLPEMPRGRAGEVEKKIASHAALYVEDCCTVEVGFGAMADVLLAGLTDRRDLGIHTGLMGDAAVDLIRRGVVTNAHKAVRRGASTTGLLFGSRDAMNFARENGAICFAGPQLTHAHANLAAIDRFIAINSAIEVDLTGQVNAEVVNGKYVGAVGGMPDFARGAALSYKGRSIIALPSTAGQGATSRIVSRLTPGTVTLARSDADVVVTEWGRAELRGQPLQERARRMLEVADPRHRDSLAREWHSARRHGPC